MAAFKAQLVVLKVFFAPDTLALEVQLSSAFRLKVLWTSRYRASPLFKEIKFVLDCLGLFCGGRSRFVFTPVLALLMLYQSGFVGKHVVAVLAWRGTLAISVGALLHPQITSLWSLGSLG